MNFFLDENFPKRAVLFLEKSGHSTIDIRGTKKEGLTDSEVFKLAQSSSSLFLTTDLDFSRHIHFNFQPHFGIIIITLSNPNSLSILEKLEWAVNFTKEQNLYNKCMVIRDKSCRIIE